MYVLVLPGEAIIIFNLDEQKCRLQSGYNSHTPHYTPQGNSAHHTVHHPTPCSHTTYHTMQSHYTPHHTVTLHTTPCSHTTHHTMQSHYTPHHAGTLHTTPCNHTLHHTHTAHRTDKPPHHWHTGRVTSKLTTVLWVCKSKAKEFSLKCHNSDSFLVNVVTLFLVTSILVLLEDTYSLANVGHFLQTGLHLIKIEVF